MIRTLGVFGLIFLIGACGTKQNGTGAFTILKGKTMGAAYEIAYDSSIDLKKEIEYTLGYFNYLLSTYDSNSLISKFNHNIELSDKDSVSYLKSIAYFSRLDSLSRLIYKESKGAFNPGLAGLINYWGFGENKKNPESADNAVIDSLKMLDFGYFVNFKGRIPDKKDLRQRLNFNAIAPGYAADIISELFDSVYKFKNYYINISGEIRVKGNNGTDSYWPIKIEKPMLNSLKQIEYCRIPLKNYSLATSGNYRQFFFSKGKRYGHSNDPRSGYTYRKEKLSSTKLAPSAAEADAYSTVCMVIGLEEAKKMIASNPYLKGFFIYEENGKYKHWSSANLAFELSKSE